MLRAVNPTFMIGGELEVRRLGFGAMRVVEDREEGVRVLRRAVELGVTLIDTADIYGAGASEDIVAEALHPYPEGLVIATKGGLGHGLQDRIRDGRPEYLRRACDASLRRLKLERIDLYQLHRHDPEVPIEESVGALHELREEGKIRLIGLSNVSLDQLRAAQSVARIVSVQNEFNRGLLISDVVLEACESEGIAFIPWRPLGEGLRDSAFELRWLLDHSPVILPIPGTSKVSHLEANMRVVAERLAKTRAATYTENEIALMKKLVGHGWASESRIPPSVAASAMRTLSMSATAGRAVSRCAAAAGVITRVSTSRTPTT
jgi:pyridoxine 4-dehydrogenase